MSDSHTSVFGDLDLDYRSLLTDNEDHEHTVDGSPFAFSKTQLGKRLYEQKDLNFLRAMKGLDGLIMGLRTDVINGLSPDEDWLDGHVTLEDVWNTFENPLQARPKHPAVVRTTSLRTDERPSSSRSILGRSKSQKLFGDRRRVFGENRVPVRPPKNIFQLMWIALHDKVIVPSFPLLISDPSQYSSNSFTCPWALPDVSTWVNQQA